MSISFHLAKHLREVHFGGNWTFVNLRDTLADVTREQALTRVRSFNTIATLVFHIDYFINVAAEVLEGKPLNGSDKLSFDHPPLDTDADWDALRNRSYANAERFAALIAQLPQHQYWETFGEEKYGNYFRNVQGIIEHTHYHLGQIVIIKKLVQEA